MNITNLVSRYVAFRRALGERCDRTEYVLRAFCRAVGPGTTIRRIGSKTVAQFVAGSGSAARTCHFRYGALKGFFQFAISRGYVDKAPLPTALPKCRSSFVPHIYSRAEIRRLLDAIPSYHPFPSRIEPTTLRALLLLLYGAGLRRGEALRLSVADVVCGKLPIFLESQQARCTTWRGCGKSLIAELARAGEGLSSPSKTCKRFSLLARWRPSPCPPHLSLLTAGSPLGCLLEELRLLVQMAVMFVDHLRGPVAQERRYYRPGEPIAQGLGGVRVPEHIGR
jgi:hypothetical protein